MAKEKKEVVAEEVVAEETIGDEVEETTEEVAAPETKDATVFRLKNGTERVFSKEVHGPDHKKIAAEFAETKKDQILG